MKFEIVSVWDEQDFDDTIIIEQASVKREWMDQSRDQYAYRCLPLNIANQHGWAVYLKEKFVGQWTGDTSQSLDSVKIYENPKGLASSHFGHGILTFSLPFLIRLEQNYSLFISGAPNHHIDGIQPCSGIYEADWAPYSFTMNWRFTRPNQTVMFTPDDPICFFFPVPRDVVQQTEPIFSTIKDQDDEFVKMYEKFCYDRSNFIPKPGEDWQKHYFKGLYPDGRKCPIDHKTKIKAEPFK